MRLATVELTPQETLALLALVRGRHAELARIVQQLEEGEGEDANRRSMLRTLAPQISALEDLILKLDGASRGL